MEKITVPVDELKQVDLKPTETVEKQVLPTAEGSFKYLLTYFQIESKHYAFLVRISSKYSLSFIQFKMLNDV